jgi:ferric-chelate reductase
MPSVSRLPFEAHPFSISSVDSTLFAPEEAVADGGPGSPYRKELVFLIGVRGGFTKRLKEVAARHESVKVYVDGPYGDAVSLGCYDTSLLIAGEFFLHINCCLPLNEDPKGGLESRTHYRLSSTSSSMWLL